MKNFLKYILTFIICVITCFGALALSTLIPQENIKENVAESAQIMKEQGERVLIWSMGRELPVHNSTDAIMLNMTYSLSNDDLVKSILKPSRNKVPGVTSQEIVKDAIGDLPREDDEYLMTEELSELVNHNSEQKVYEYARYWHGYIPLLKVLLLVFNITQIRTLFFIITILLIGYLIYRIWKENKILAISTMICFFMFDLLIWPLNIQGVFVMIITLAMSCFIANKKINSKNISLAFFIVGAMVAYFDFLTFPLLSFLMPLIIYNFFNKEENKKELFLQLIKNMFSWGIGYVAIWASKWILIDIIYQDEMVLHAISQTIYRTGVVENRLPLGQMIVGAVLNNLASSYAIIILIFLFFIFVISIIVFDIKGNVKKYLIGNKKLIYYIAITMVYGWYIVFAEHSWQHYFYTYRLQLASMLAIMCIIFDNDFTEVKRNFNLIVSKIKNKKEEK